jgi:intracellular multiplication protein IcmL
MDKAIEKDNSSSRHYLSLLRYCQLAAVVGVLLAAILVYVVMDKKPGVFYASTTNGNVQRLYSVNQPSLSKQYLLKWSEMVVRNSFSLNFDSLQNSLDQVRPDYTAEGYKSFNAALNSSGVLSAINQQKLVISPLVSDVPVILYQGVVHGRYTWRIQMPLLLKYTSASDSVQQKRIVTIDVSRVSTTSAPKSGIQITNLYVMSTD